MCADLLVFEDGFGVPSSVRLTRRQHADAASDARENPTRTLAIALTQPCAGGRLGSTDAGRRARRRGATGARLRDGWRPDAGTPVVA